MLRAQKMQKSQKKIRCEQVEGRDDVALDPEIKSILDSGESKKIFSQI